MHRSNDTLMAGEHPLNAGGTETLGRRPTHPMPTPGGAAPTGWGFTVPVLVVCVALWFLLNAGQF